MVPNRFLWPLFALVMGFAIGGSIFWGLYGPNASIERVAAYQQHASATEEAKNEKEETDKALARYTLWLMVFTGLLAAATVGLGVATVGLYFTGEKQAQLGRDEFNSVHRPRIRIKHVWLLNEFWHEDPLRILVVCVNVGATAARIIEYGGDFLVLHRGQTLPPKYDFALAKKINMVLPSGVSGEFPNFVTPLTEDAEISIRRDENVFYHIGYVHYLDAVGRPRTTAFCRRFQLDRVGRHGRFLATGDPDYEYED